MIQGRKRGLLEVDPKLIADSTRGFKVLRISCENFSFWFAQISRYRDNNSGSDTIQTIYIRIITRAHSSLNNR